MREKWNKEVYISSCLFSCRGILRGLSELDSRSYERAIWELMQNAHDVALQDNSERIKIKLSDSEFIFAHNGKSFNHESFLSLVKQASKKRVSSLGKEGYEDEENHEVGQYGTGFITTHSFGRKILVRGSLELDKQLYPAGKYISINNFEIDRTYDDIERFTEAMVNQLAAVDELRNLPFEDVPKEWTEFHYLLSTAYRAKENAQKAIKAAVKQIPYVMTINERIGNVSIEDETTGQNWTFTKEPLSEENGLKVCGIHITENGSSRLQKIFYLSSDEGKDMVILPLSDAHTAESLKDVAKLYVNFPLLGTEKFGMDFVFHSSRFFPVEKRNTIFLPTENGNVKEKYEENIKVLNKMADMLFDYLGNHSASIEGWEKIASLQFDCLSSAEKATKDFFEEFKQKWVDFFEKLPIIDTREQKKSLSDVYVFSADLVNSLDKASDERVRSIYKIAEDKAVKQNRQLPSSQCILSWSRVVGTWKREDEANNFLSMEDLAKYVSGEDEWNDEKTLHELDIYIEETGNEKMFDKYALILNYEGKRCMKNDLKKVVGIPRWLVKLAARLIPEETEKFVNQSFADLVSVEFNIKNLRDHISSYLKDLRSETLDKDEKECCELEVQKTLAKLSMIYNPESGCMPSCRRSIMPIVCEHLEIDYDEKMLTSLSDSKAEIAKLPFRYLMENLLLEISLNDTTWIAKNYEYVKSLHKALRESEEYYNTP